MCTGLGILYLSVIAGVMNANVCALTKTPGIVTSIFGMWQATHSLPVEPSLWCVCSPVSPCAVRSRAGAVAIEAYLVRGLSELRVVLRGVHIVAIEAGDAAAIHNTLHEVVPLHAIFVRRAVRKMREAQLAQCVILECQ